MRPTAASERALVLAPRGRDAAMAAAMLVEAGIYGTACESLIDLVIELERGVGFVVLTEESVDTADIRPLKTWLDSQAEWSDLPFILLTHRGGGLERNPAAARHLKKLGNVAFLERPFHPTTLVSLSQSALRARRRQYEARGRLEALHESEARFRLLFETLDEGFCVIRFHDGPDGPLGDYVHVQANPAYERHAGIANVVGQSVRTMVPDEAEGWVELYRQVLLTGRPMRFERELAATGRQLELSAFRVEPATRLEVAVVFQDITARRRAERALIELNESLESRVSEALKEREAVLAKLHEAQKLETLGQLTGGVAHDFNNLLTPITGALDLLDRRYSAQDPRTSRSIQNALRSADRAKTLVQRLLGFARRQSLETKAVDVGDLISDMRDLVASSVGPIVEVKVAATADLPPALVDPNQLELAILNLAVNARDAMPEGGVLTLAVERTLVGPRSIQQLEPGAYVRVSVIDTGIGMSEETLSRAVEPFYSTKDVGKGTGLGLSMVHGLAAQLGGAFTLSSALGKGTRADLFLPVAAGDAPSMRREPTASAASALSPLSLLLVDDEDLVRIGTAEMLRELGHKVIEASSGGDALAKLNEGAEIDALVTDYMMPVMDGAELARRARTLRPQLPVLVITGYVGGSLEIGLPQLAKPFRQGHLAAALRQLFHATNVVSLPRRRR
ncbi:MAG: response regulator [Caulobacteraceae bacterium]|nr:response regulator [Caulobacteraceae bacterium]